MIDLYTWTTPNGWKASCTVEELGLPYTVHELDISTGVQKEADFLASIRMAVSRRSSIATQ